MKEPKSKTAAAPGKARGPGTIGPVADLESHLPPEWWRELFNSLYLKTDGDVVENGTNTTREVDAVVAAAGLGKGDRILDLCCGQGRHALELARRGFTRVTGVDRSRYLVRLARKRARAEGLDVAFREGDARTARLPDSSMDCVMLMGNSFGYFEEETEDHRVVDNVIRLLRGGGTLVLDIADGDWLREQFERRTWEWIDQNHFVCRERSLSADGRRLISREVVTHAERGVIADQFYAERLYSREQITAMLKDCGFERIRLHGTFDAESDRGPGGGQDLGMMARRLFVTATAAQKAPARPSAGRAPLQVTVVLGDPRLPDEVKLGGQFNAEDFETVARLKSALAAMEGYRFTFLDDHATLRADLEANHPDLVFNLCDEGLDNDAFMELHVPALLEMLRIPYTGAGPACLGLCYDKSLVRAVAEATDIPVPLETYVAWDDRAVTLPSTFPALLKPAFGDSSIGITQHAVVHDAEALVAYRDTLRQTLPGRPVLIQEFLTGAEYSVSLIGNPETSLEPLPILEVDYSGLPQDLPQILGYESKWEAGSPYWDLIRYREAQLDDEVKRTLVAHSALLFERLRCRDYARFDFRADAAGTVKLLEVNPNPGWCWDGKLNLMAGFAGQTYADLLRRVIEAARARLSLHAPARRRTVAAGKAA
ncbi:MAG: methyltransferase domain-containing protein [Hyphomicrobiales bacterium]|nr:methyltransferase domain-containing protein [Hyphomicrobiales bacterium]